MGRDELPEKRAPPERARAARPGPLAMLGDLSVKGAAGPPAGPVWVRPRLTLWDSRQA